MPVPLAIICFRDPRMWHRGVPNTSHKLTHGTLTYHGERCMHWRGRLVKRIDKAAAQRFAQDPALKFMDDGGLADGRLVFEDNTREVFTESANPHRVITVCALLNLGCGSTTFLTRTLLVVRGWCQMV